jgi:hypothetical protein
MTNNNTQGTDMISRIRPAYLTALAIVCLLWAATASATDKPVAVQPTATATANGGYADSWSNADADSNAVSVSDAHASQHQDQTATANNEGNHQSTTITHKAVKQAPSVYASASNATLGCFRPVGLSASIPGVGAGFTAGKLNKDCLLLTAADEELRRGNLSASIAFRCKTKLYKDTLGPDCEAMLNTQTAVRSQPATPVAGTCSKDEKAPNAVCYSPSELKERDERIIKTVSGK